jgi:uroporphyrinogen decarboxylase
MTTRERFNATMAYEPVDRPLFVPYMGASEPAMRRWKTEGLGDRHWSEPFGFDLIPAHVNQFTFVPVKHFTWPPYEEQILSEEDNVRLVRDERGVTKYTKTDCDDMTHYVAYPVTDRASWEQYKSRLDPTTPGRLPADFDRLAAVWRDRDYILGIGGTPMGLFSGLREIIGPEPLMIACALEPDWVRAMAEHLADFWLRLFRPVVPAAQPDFLFLWELICTNKGPMISPPMFRDLFLPSYQKLIGGLKDAGLRHVWFDCQGRNYDLLPLFIEAGGTGTLPLEVRSGMDVIEVRRRHPRLQLIGGIERYALARGPQAIDSELARVAPLIHAGGYIPSVDHYFSADISWENLCYFFDGLRRLVFAP